MGDDVDDDDEGDGDDDDRINDIGIDGDDIRAPRPPVGSAMVDSNWSGPPSSMEDEGANGLGDISIPRRPPALRHGGRAGLGGAMVYLVGSGLGGG